VKNPGRWLRAALVAVLALLAHRAFRDEHGYIPLISDLNLAVHETGHYVFAPFGELMQYMGGSIFQTLVPLVFAGYFLFGKPEHRDRFAAAVCGWWTAINVLGVSIYAADARAGQLMLLSGATGEDDPAGHDFYMIFAHLGVLNSDTIYAGRMRAIAGILCFASLLAAGWFAVKPKPEANDEPGEVTA
jgi:hypothetical protein